jgi:hypothetical protein
MSNLPVSQPAKIPHNWRFSFQPHGNGYLLTLEAPIITNFPLEMGTTELHSLEVNGMLFTDCVVIPDSFSYKRNHLVECVIKIYAQSMRYIGKRIPVSIGGEWVGGPGMYTFERNGKPASCTLADVEELKAYQEALDA